MEDNRFLRELLIRYPALAVCSDSIFNAYSILAAAFCNSGTLFTCGNGGSQSDADHIVGELSKGFILKRELPQTMISDFSKKMGEDASDFCSKLQMGLRAMNLSSQNALSSAFSNDIDSSMALAQQLFVMARKGDVVIGLSTSGNAENIYNTFKVGGVLGVKRILFTGNKHGKCEKYTDCVIAVPESETYKIQELHLPVYHTLCMMLEDLFYGKH